MFAALYRWRGVLVMTALAFATIWFALTGDLVLYISPASAWLAVPMAFLTLGLCAAWVVSQARRPKGQHAHDDHAHDDEDEEIRMPRRALPRAAYLASAAVVTAFVIAVVVLPPSTLSAATAIQRDVTSTVATTGVASLADATVDGSQLSGTYGLAVWSSLLAQTSDAAFYADKPAAIDGFITPDPAGDADVFYLTRFFITHCAVDAQPVAVPVFQPGWDLTLAVGEWVNVTGDFGPNRGRVNTAPIALIPAQITPIEEPEQPYLF